MCRVSTNLHKKGRIPDHTNLRPKEKENRKALPRNQQGFIFFAKIRLVFEEATGSKDYFLQRPKNSKTGLFFSVSTFGKSHGQEGREKVLTYALGMPNLKVVPWFSTEDTSMVCP
jgi:hypothetical protein